MVKSRYFLENQGKSRQIKPPRGLFFPKMTIDETGESGERKFNAGDRLVGRDLRKCPTPRFGEIAGFVEIQGGWIGQSKRLGRFAGFAKVNDSTHFLLYLSYLKHFFDMNGQESQCSLPNHPAVVRQSRCSETSGRGWRGWCKFDQQGDAGLRFAVECEVDGIKAGQVEFQLLERDDEVARAEVGVAGQHDFGRQIDAGHDEAAVGVHEIEAQFVRAFVLVTEGDAQGDGALRVRGGDLLGDDGVESAEKVELAVLFGGSIAQNSDLDIHRGPDYMNSANTHAILSSALVVPCLRRKRLGRSQLPEGETPSQTRRVAGNFRTLRLRRRNDDFRMLFRRSTRLQTYVFRS